MTDFLRGVRAGLPRRFEVRFETPPGSGRLRRVQGQVCSDNQDGSSATIRMGIFLGTKVQDDRAIAADYQLHLGETALNPDGTFESSDATVRHPDRTVTGSDGGWGGAVSNVPDRSGNPRLAAGFSSASFEEADGSEGGFSGSSSDRARISGSRESEAV